MQCDDVHYGGDLSDEPQYDTTITAFIGRPFCEVRFKVIRVPSVTSGGGTALSRLTLPRPLPRHRLLLDAIKEVTAVGVALRRHERLIGRGRRHRADGLRGFAVLISHDKKVKVSRAFGVQYTYHQYV